MDSSAPHRRRFMIRIRSARSKQIVQEIRGACTNAIDVEWLASDVWNSGFCLGESYGLRVYMPIGNPLRWRKVDQLGYW